MARSVYYFTDSPGRGGAEAALVQLIESLDRSTWQPTLLYNSSAEMEPVADAARALGASVRAVAPLPIGLAGALRVPRFVRELRRQDPVVFHAHLTWPLAAMYPLAAAVVARVPAVVATFHLFPPMSLHRRSLRQQRLLGARIGRGIAVSQAIAEQVRDVLGWPAEKVEVIRNGVAADRFRHGRDPELRRALTAGADDVVFLTVARLDHQKGLDVLLRAVAAVEGARFVIAGAGPERGRLEGEAAALGLGTRVLFLGQRDDIPSLLAASDAFVLPSRFEGTPIALLEAMAAARPVVATGVPGTAEVVVDGESALLVPPDEPDALARALRRIVAEHELRERLGAAARRRVERDFSATAGARRVTAVYDELLRSRR
jgi:glycosyltransferase involved in cell wall biosynthesis